MGVIMDGKTGLWGIDRPIDVGSRPLIEWCFRCNITYIMSSLTPGTSTLYDERLQRSTSPYS
jgi:hypothetical protein